MVLGRQEYVLFAVIVSYSYDITKYTIGLMVKRYHNAEFTHCHRNRSPIFCFVGGRSLSLRLASNYRNGAMLVPFTLVSILLFNKRRSKNVLLRAVVARVP